MTEITQILQRIQAGDADASDALLRKVYDELRALAAAKMAREAPGQTLQPTALVHDAWLKLTNGESPNFENRRHFFGAAAEAMRRVLVDRARRRRRIRHGGDMERDNRDLDSIAATVPDDKILAIHEALEALEAADEIKAQVVKLKYFIGLKTDEIAQTLDISISSVERYWAYSSAWMMDWIRENQAISKKN